MTRGMETFFYKSALLNPLRYGLFAWELFSHKLCRWLLPYAGVLALVALATLATEEAWARWALAAVGLLCALALLAWVWPEHRGLPRVLSLPAYLVAGNLAGLHSGVNPLRGAQHVPGRGYLVEPVLPQEPPDGRHPRVLWARPDLVVGAGRACRHRPELVDSERYSAHVPVATMVQRHDFGIAPVEADAGLGVE